MRVALKGWWLTAVLLGCGSPDATGTVRARLFAAEADGGYAYTIRSIQHVESIGQLRSAYVDFRAGSNVVSELTGLRYERGRPFELAFHLEGDVVVPDDEASLDGLSAFAALNACAEYFLERGAASGKAMDVLYYPRMDSVLLGDLRPALTDNAAFAPAFDAFFIIPPFMLDALPLQVNQGVMCHEYGHAIISHQAFPPGAQPAQTEKNRAFTSMEEGVADLFGFAATGEPDPIARSIKPGLIEGRNLAEPLTYTTQDAQALDGFGPDDEFDPHHHGSFLARAVYEALPRDAEGRVTAQTRAAMAEALLRALDAHPFDGRNAMKRLVEAYLQQQSAADRVRACGVFNLRLAPLTHPTPFEGCP